MRGRREQRELAAHPAADPQRRARQQAQGEGPGAEPPPGPSRPAPEGACGRQLSGPTDQRGVFWAPPTPGPNVSPKESWTATPWGAPYA